MHTLFGNALKLVLYVTGKSYVVMLTWTYIKHQFQKYFVAIR